MSRTFVQNVPEKGSSFGAFLNTALHNACGVDIAVSYLQMSGWFLLQQHLKRLSARRVRILTTDQMNITQPAVLAAALGSGMQVKCYRGARQYHSKVYIIRGKTLRHNVAVVGSANVSGSGMETGIEAGLQITDPKLFKQIADWFERLFHDPNATEVTRSFIGAYEKRWRPASRMRAHASRTGRKRSGVLDPARPEDRDVLDDVFSTIRLPVGTLGFDHAGNNIRNLSRVVKVLSRYPRINGKEKSELHLLGFMKAGDLSALGRAARKCRSEHQVADLWCSWLRKRPEQNLRALNPRLASFRRAATRFWRLRPDVRACFFRELNNPNERTTLQAIELCCNGSDLVEAFTLADFKGIAPAVVTGGGLGQFIAHAISDYRDNKGSRSWKTPDRGYLLRSWR